MVQHNEDLFGAPAEAAASSGWITAHCDGGSRGNPGPSGYGVYVQDEGGKSVAELSEFLGKKTNNFAEYSGLLAALNFALEHGHPQLRVVSDSELMVKQIKGQYQVKSPELRPLYDEAKRRISKLDKFEIQHVLRNKNKRADELANEAMDRGTGKSVRVPSPAPVAAKAVHPKIEFGGRPASKVPPPAISGRILRGFVKNGVVHLLEGELPENAFVKVTVE
jgi:probable phosphoglycerate mutase